MSFENQNNNVMPATTFNSTGANNSAKNMSGKGASYPVPDVVAKRFNWGAFALDWIWGLGNKSYITLITIPLWCLCFIPQVMLLSGILSFGFSIWFGIKGNEWAWQNKHFNSVEAFHNYQRKWAIAGVIYIIINVAIIPIIIAALTLPVLMSDTSAQYNHIARLKTANTIMEATLMNEAMEEKCNLSSVGLAKCFEKRMSGDRENNIIKSTDSSVWTFNGNGICQNNGDCDVTIEIRHNGKSDIATIPIYVNSKGYIYIKENDLKEYQNK